MSLFARKHVLAGVLCDLGDEQAFLVHRRVDVEAAGDAGQVIVVSVPRGRVDAPGSVLERHVIRRDENGGPIDPGMPGLEAFEVASFEFRQDRVRAELQFLGHDRQELLGEDVDFVLRLDRHIIGLRMEGDGQIGRKGPGGRRPDDNRDLLSLEPGVFLGHVRDHRELDVDRRRGMVLVLDLGLGQGGLAVDAPVDRPLPLVNVPRGEESGQVPQDIGFVGGIHGEIRLVPFAQDAEPDEPVPLDIDVLEGVFPAFIAEFGQGHVLLPLPEELVHVDLDRKAVAVPAGDVGRQVPLHALALDDEVLEDLVQGGAQVDMPVGIRRAVMQDEGQESFPLFQDLAVEAHLLPLFDDLGLFLGERRLHGEGRSGAGSACSSLRSCRP